MHQLLLTLLITTLGAESLSVFRYSNIYIVNFEDETNGIDYRKDPPPHSEAAKMARYVVHNSDWCILSYKSLHSKTSQYPMGTVLSVSDGPVNKGTGTPYFYVSEVEDAVQDTDKDARCSITMTMAESDYCKQKKLDPQYPTCPQVSLVGQLKKVQNGTAEQTYAKEALFSRHPSMKTWPEDHHFFFAKLKIDQVVVQDYFGGPIYVDINDYFNASPLLKM